VPNLRRGTGKVLRFHTNTEQASGLRVESAADDQTTTEGALMLIDLQGFLVNMPKKFPLSLNSDPFPPVGTLNFRLMESRFRAAPQNG
jgi:hypothetical protein